MDAERRDRLIIAGVLVFFALVILVLMCAGCRSAALPPLTGGEVPIILKTEAKIAADTGQKDMAARLTQIAALAEKAVSDDVAREKAMADELAKYKARPKAPPWVAWGTAGAFGLAVLCAGVFFLLKEPGLLKAALFWGGAGVLGIGLDAWWHVLGFVGGAVVGLAFLAGLVYFVYALLRLRQGTTGTFAWIEKVLPSLPATATNELAALQGSGRAAVQALRGK